jgi:zinc protease
MNYSRASCVATVMSLLLLAVAVRAAEPKKVTSVEGITEYQFDNGAKLLLFPDPSRPTVTVNMTVLVGSRHEGYGETGMAHLLEHMVFKGTPTFPNPPQALHDRGANFNGSTWVDRTNYYETLPATTENLEFALKLEADRLMNSFIRREDLLSEMTVVRNEFEMGENSPEALLNKRVMATAYEWHNYGKSTIGNRSDIERVPIENLQDFYKKYYQPDNVVVIVAGKFDDVKALEHTTKYFGSIPRPSRKLSPTYTEEPPQDGERQVELRRVGDVLLVEAVYHVPAGSHEDYAAIDMLGTILSTQPSGRLYKALVETKKASSVAAESYAWHDPGVFDITLRVRKEMSLDEAEKIMESVVDDVIAKGVTPEEVNRAKQQFTNARNRAIVNTSRVAVQLSEWAGMGDWRYYFLHRDRVEKVTPADVQRVAAKYLRKANRTLGHFIPSEKPVLVTIPEVNDIHAAVADYKGRPPIAAAEAFEFNYQNIEARTKRSSLGGVRVASLPKKSRDQEVHITLRLHYGTAEELKPFREAASLLPALMNRGTKKLNYQQLRDELERLESTVNISGDVGYISVSVRSKKPNLPELLDLMRQVLREPLLDSSELDVLRQSRLAQFEQARTEPGALARARLGKTLYPYPSDDVRAYLTPDEEIARFKAVTIEQVRKLYNDFVGAAEGELILVGDFDADSTLKDFSKMLSGWEPKQRYARIQRRAFENVAGGRQSILTPDKANATYRAGLTFAMDDKDPDYPALTIGDHILGSSTLSSRLGDRVREKDGLTYGVSSGLNASAEDKLTSFSIGAICKPANMSKVEAAILDEIDRLLKDGVPADELERAKTSWLQSEELSRSSDQGIASRLYRSLRTGQSLVEYDAAVEEQVKALKPTVVIAALKKRIDPKRLVVVVAGDFDKKDAE